MHSEFSDQTGQISTETLVYAGRLGACSFFDLSLRGLFSEYEKRMHKEISNTFGRKTIANELDNKPVRDFTLTEKDIRPMFVQVQVLERGQYFVSNMIMCLQRFPTGHKSVCVTRI